MREEQAAQGRDGTRRWRRWDTVIVVAFVCVLIGLAVPVMLRARTKAHALFCRRNLEQLGMSLAMYASEHDGYLPPAARWSDCTLPIAGARHFSDCPAAKPGGFAMNQAASGLKLEDIPDHDHFILLFDGDSEWNASGGAESVQYRHHDGAHFVLANGAIQWVESGGPHPYAWEP
ncbi:MAG TPA: hypothetical protein QGH10_20865 [Armatimonadota bacterium]|nr:hypothetical protein [Armatimonadota bacterium]